MARARQDSAVPGNPVQRRPQTMALERCRLSQGTQDQGNAETRPESSQEMRAAIYARVSTSNHGQNPHVQIRELREHCLRRGWEIADEYVDSGISGTKEPRPQLDRLLADCRRRRVDIVLVYRYDRFARSLRHLVNALEEFRALGIEFVSIHEGVDTTCRNGPLIFGIFASIAEFERELIRDRVKSGLRNARAKGKTLGRPRFSLESARIRRR